MTLHAKREKVTKECNWCIHAHVAQETITHAVLNGGRVELDCEVMRHMQDGTLFDRVYARLHACPMEDAMVAEEAWEDYNSQGECPFWSLATDDFEFACFSCHGSGEGNYPDSRSGCYHCKGTGVDFVLQREYWPWG